jgi:predicted outer membrane repeat protein
MWFQSNVATGGVASGGALRLLNSNSVIQDCLFEGNSAGAEGGAIFNAGGAILVSNCEFVGNGAPRGGGLYCREDASSVIGSVFRDAAVVGCCSPYSAWGLGAYALNSTVSFADCSFRAMRGGDCGCNDREYAGLGLFVIGAQSDVLITSCEFAELRAERNGRGGAIAIGWPGNNRGSARILRSVFRSNFASIDGGAIAMQSTDRLVVDGLDGVPTVFENNSANRDGGAISINRDWVDSGTFLLDESRFVNNAAGSAGGAIWIRQTGGAGSRVLTDSVFLTNSAVNGGGVYLEGSAIRSQLGRTVYCGNDPNDVQGQYNELFSNCFTISCADSDDNGYPDTCEIPIIDCNQDGIADDEQLVGNDVNNDLVPDDCQTRFLDFAGLEAELVPIASAGSSGYPATTALCWRVYAKTINESASVICVFGNAERSFSITASGGLYQNGSGGDTVEGISCTKSNPVLYDSFFTIEATCDQQIELLTTPSFPAFNSSGNFSTSNGAYYVTPGAAGSSAGSDKRILLMQLTTNQAIKPTTSINILGRHGVPDPNNGWYEWQAFGLQIPDPILVDCNNNGVHDAIEIATGATVDADRNGLPDNCQQCRGDVDANGVVNLDDLIEVFVAWGDPFPGAADLNNDGVVNGADLAQVISGWGTCLPPL